MKVLDFTGLKNVQKVTKGLSQLLADLQVYYTNLRGFHWNIKGKNFYVLHNQFEDMYNDAADKVDEVAERLRMLGETPQHNFSDYLKVSQIKESGLVTDGDQAMKNILETYKYLIHLERQISADAADIGDDATVTLMGDYIEEQEKAVWMMVAYFQ